MNWWRKVLRDTEADTSAIARVCAAQERLDETLAIVDRVEIVTSSIKTEVKRNHFSDRIRESYGQTFPNQREHYSP